MGLLLEQANSVVNKGSPLPLPAFGHRSVCFSCGLSILRARSRSYNIKSDRPEWNIILRNVPPHLVSRLNRVCGACWMAAYREVRCQNQHDSNRSTLQDVGTAEHINIPASPALPVARQPSTSKEIK
ncbi:hypothetical protein ACJJTC_011779 [Scirpophaga incertulas]